MVFIHSDVENLIYFLDKNGVSAYNEKVIAYAMQKSDIVALFYTKGQIEEYYKENENKRDLPIKWYWSEKVWNKINN